MLTITNNKLRLTDTAYNVGKKLVWVFIPGLSSLYFGLAPILDLPSSEKVMGTLAVIATFLGVCLTISSRQYEASGAAYDGQLVVIIPEDGPKIFSLQLDGDPEELEQKDSVTFKVTSHDSPIEEEL
jgi:hypothetical protein